LGYPGADNHIFFDGTGKVWVPFQNYISVPLLQLIDKLLEVLSTEGTTTNQAISLTESSGMETAHTEPIEHFLKVSGLLYYVLNANYNSNTSSYGIISVVYCTITD